MSSVRLRGRRVVNFVSVSDFLTFCSAGNGGTARKTADMRPVTDRQHHNGTRRPVKLLAWAIILGLIFGLIGFGEIAENRLRVARNLINKHPASGDIVLVAIDEPALRQEGRWPWPRARYADLVDRIAAAKPKMQVHDILHVGTTNPADDRRLAQSFERAPNDYLAMLDRTGRDGERQTIVPLPTFARHTGLGTISLLYNFASEVWSVPYAGRLGDKPIPSFASLISGTANSSTSLFPVDYSIDPETVPLISAHEILSANFDPARISGKTVVVGTNSVRIGDQYLIPGHQKLGGVYVHIIAAETLKAGLPVSLGWLPAYLLAALAVCAVLGRRKNVTIGSIAAAAVVLLVVPVFLERSHIFVDVTAGLFVILVVSAGLTWRSLAGRGVVNAVTGLPNLTALKKARHERDRPLIAARILNYPEMVSTLSMANERSLVEQIVARFRVGSERIVVYQGDEGIFAFTAEPGTALGNHVEALAALFRSAAKVDGKPLDLAVTFGVEIGSGRSIANRLGSALLAADEAAAEGLRWKYHDPERLKDANWKLSLLGQLDSAIDNGEVWVAYQPQVDLRTGKIRGAEALARWTHPEKGPISPLEFVSAAEQSGRIEKLTLFVLDRAIAAAAAINGRHGNFDMAVNLSARMLADRHLALQVKKLLDRHGLQPERLTLELTETAAMAGNGSDIEPLHRLRELGVRISIDDYGTGMSTLEYLKKVPASEIKIDQSFVKSMRDNRSDLVMVQSTIALAHSLGRTVVAEGVESREVLDLLVAMKCEFAQGFIIGRPVSFDGLTKRLLAGKGRRVA